MITPAMEFAREFVSALVERGVRDVVLCPGSRSGPLAHALAEAGAEDVPLGTPQVNLHVRIDERSAAFLALGLSRGRAVADARRGGPGVPAPVAIVTTSGTAVGNLMPAVMEAHHSGIPLLLLTADRPEELRGVGANQTTNQMGMFDRFTRWSMDVEAPAEGDPHGRAALIAAQAVDAATGRVPAGAVPVTPADIGPVQVNLQFRDPLGPDGGLWQDVRVPSVPQHSPRPPEWPALPDESHGVVIAGDGAGPAARELAEARGWPLLAEPTSRAREGACAVAGYQDLLAADAAEGLVRSVRLVVVVGRPTLTRGVSRLIARTPSLIAVAHGARWTEAPAHADTVLPAMPSSWLVPGAESDPSWLQSWKAAARAAARAAVPWDRRVVARTVLDAVAGSGAALVVGSSLSIRAVDAVAPAWSVGGSPAVIANRGLAGIDGTVATALGVGLGSGGPVVALMGDVTFLHDVGGLLVGPHERRPDARIVVVNDGGGRIFGTLEHASAPEANVERVFTTPHGADLGALCAGYGVGHVRVSGEAALRDALAAPLRGLQVVEAVL